MKHKFTVLLSAAAIIVLALVAVKAYDRHQIRVRADQGTQAIVAQQAQKEYALKQAHLQQNLQKLTIQCQNFTVAYGQLTAAQKAHIPAPDCILVSN